MTPSLTQLVGSYDPDRPLAEAATIPSGWYLDGRLAELEQQTVFSRSWIAVGRVDQLAEAGCYVTAEVAGEPIVVVCGRDGALRGFYNVCRHHAAAVCTMAEGQTPALKCPYHGWTYSLEGDLKGVPEFDGVCDFDKSQNGLRPVRVEAWENFVFVCLDESAACLRTLLGELPERVKPLGLDKLRFAQRRSYELACNWKVYVDNYLDGGYHVPHIHKGLGSVLNYAEYRIENSARYCLQSSPIDATGGEAATAAVRGGRMAYYYWLHPNFMMNWYEGIMDTNLVIPLGVDRCRVVFDFYFADGVGEREQSMAVSERIQQEDIAICESVQRGLRSRAYDVGRLSVRREAGEHLFHRLLHADLAHGV